MSNTSIPASAAAAARMLQIINIGLLTGAITFGAFAVLTAQEPQDGLGIMTIIAVADAVAMMVAWFVVPLVIVAKQRPRIADLLSETPLEPSADAQAMADSAAYRQLLGVYQTKSIIAAAILEGTIFLCAMAYWMEGHPIALMVGGAFLMFMIVTIPTAARIENWVEGEVAAIEQMRRF